jgi:DNA-binding IscR family transcriptional regulator
MLARPAREIRVGEVVRGHEQDQSLVECFRPDGGACTLLPRCRLRGMLAAAEDAFYQHLDRYTLADCLAATGSSAHERASRKRPRRSGATAPQRRSIRLKLAERRG